MAHSLTTSSTPAAAMMTPHRIISVHFPKAGGTSLHTQLAGLLHDDLVFDWTHDPLTPAGAEIGTFPVGKRIVHGHFRAQRYSGVDAYWMTFLRHPVDNLISIYFLELVAYAWPRSAWSLSSRKAIYHRLCIISSNQKTFIAHLLRRL